MSIPPYPLAWPDGLPRTERKAASQFRTSLSAALENVRKSLVAVDRYEKVRCNLQAIHHILEARRTEMRHGGLHIVRQTFKGFAAIAAPEQWWQVLGVTAEATSEQIAAAYRRLARAAHSDHGGTDAAMARLNAARDAGIKARSA